MKKITFLIIAIMVAGITQKISAQTFEEGNIVFSAGYGWPNLVGAVFNAYESETGYNATSLGPVYIKAEYCIADHVGLGINFAWASNKVTYNFDGYDANYNLVTYEEKITRSTFSILARINYHFGDFDKFDPYFGGGLGYRNAKWTFTDNDPTTDIESTFPNLVPFGFELTIGGRYFVAENFGIYAELGLAKSPIQGGIFLKL